jgi:hypothetical protein
MQRFYFHIFAGDLGLIQDTEGVDLNDLRAAHHRAVRIMYRTMSTADDIEDWRRWRVNVADANGNSLLTVLYRSHLVSPRRTIFGGAASFCARQWAYGVGEVCQGRH